MNVKLILCGIFGHYSYDLSFSAICDRCGNPRYNKAYYLKGEELERATKGFNIVGDRILKDQFLL